MSHIARENIVMSCGNLPLFTAGQRVFDEDGLFVGKPGQMVVMNPQTGLSVGAGITIATTPRIRIGVGEANGKIRWGAAEDLYGAYIQSANAEPAGCGVAETWALYWDISKVCGDKFVVHIRSRNEDTENMYPLNKWRTDTATVNLASCACSTCPGGVDQFKLACEIAKQLNGKSRNPDAAIQRAIKAKADTADYYVTPMFGADATDVETMKVYCINPVKDTCDNCISTDVALFSVVADEVTTNLRNSVAAEDENSLQAQLPGILKQIKKILGNNGSAFITKGAGRCCPYQLHVNTCLNDFAILDGDGVEIEPCKSFNPFATPIDITNDCINCGTGATKVFKGGIFVVAKESIYECANNGAERAKKYFGNDIQINPAQGFDCGASFVKQIQKAVLPKNLGIQWIEKDYASEKGGWNRDFRPDNSSSGRFGTPLKGDRASSISPCLKCGSSPCSYVIDHQLPARDFSAHGREITTRMRTSILIPTSDTVTMADFEAVYNPWMISAGGTVKNSITCSQDQDQIEATLTVVAGSTGHISSSTTFPDTNGPVFH